MENRRTPFGRRVGRRGMAGLLGLLLLAPSPVLAKGRGVYDTVPLKEREEHLVKTAGDYEGLFLRRGYRYRDPALDAFLQDLSQRLHPPPTDPYIRYRVFAFRDPTPNAFALPDGQIYVNTGMLARLENAAQVASLLAHEVNHTAGHHGIVFFRSIRKKALTSMVLSPIGLVVAGDLTPLLLTLRDLFLIQAILGYSRDLEEEADRRGLQLVLDAGYDVREFPRIYEILGQDPEGLRPQTGVKWSTHPRLQDRVAYMREMIADLEGIDFGQRKRDTAAFRALRFPIALMTVGDLVHADLPRSAVEMGERLVADYGDDAQAHYALGEAFRALGPLARIPPDQPPTEKEKRRARRKRAELPREERRARLLATEAGRANLAAHLGQAAAAYRRALDLEPSLTEAWRGLGLALEELGEDREAGRALLAYVRAHPDATDKSLILETMQRITARLQTRETVRAE